MPEPLPWESLCGLARRAQAETTAEGRAYYRARLVHLMEWYTRYPSEDDDHDPKGYYAELMAYKLAECLPEVPMSAPALLDAALTRLRQGHRLETAPCSLCGYVCGFRWHRLYGLYYDPGCHCRDGGWAWRSSAQLAQHIVMNQAHIADWVQETPTP